MNFSYFISIFIALTISLTVESGPLKSPYRLSPIVRRIISTKLAPGAIGPYNQAIQVGDTLYVSGNIGIDPATGNLVPGGIEDEAVQSLQNMGFILSEAGLTYDNVVKTDILLANISDFTVVNEVYEKFFKANFPARVTYQVGALPKGALIEIDAIAVIGDLIDV